MESIFLYEKIKFAREARGLSQIELGNLLGVSKQYISLLELGKCNINSQVMFNLVNILKFPFSFYKKPIPAEMKFSGFYRSRKTTPKKMKIATENMVSIYLENDCFFKQFVDFPTVSKDIFNFTKGKVRYSFNEIEQITSAIREYWNLGIKPITNLTSIIQQNGIVIINLQVPDRKIDAFSTISSDGTPYIFIGSKEQTAARLRFDLAHELGHLVLHNNYNNNDLLDKEVYDAIEDEANYFASSFLLPKQSFSQDAYSHSINHLLLLKKKWKTSMSCMIYRCNYLNLFTENQIKYLKNQMTSKCYWRHEPLDDVWSIEKPFLHKQIIKILMQNKILSSYDIIENLCLPVSEIEDSYFLETGTLTNFAEPNIINFDRNICVN